MRAPRGEVHVFRCGSAGFRIYTVLYVLIPHAFAPIHSFRGSATNVNFSPRARRPREFQQKVLCRFCEQLKSVLVSGPGVLPKIEKKLYIKP